VVLTEIEGKSYVLDGRNRLDALEHLGCDLSISCDAWWGHHLRVEDPFTFVISANIQRRHLTAEQRRELIAKVLKTKPELSNNAIAKQVKADDKTVAKGRTELQANSEIPNKTERTEASGRKARVASLSRRRIRSRRPSRRSTTVRKRRMAGLRLT
jgi:hypothetical protein